MKTVAETLANLLGASEWTQEEASRELGTSRVTVNQLLNGRRTLTPEMAVRLATVFPPTAEGTRPLPRPPTALQWLRLQAVEDLAAAEAALERWARAYTKERGGEAKRSAEAGVSR